MSSGRSGVGPDLKDGCLANFGQQAWMKQLGIYRDALAGRESRIRQLRVDIQQKEAVVLRGLAGVVQKPRLDELFAQRSALNDLAGVQQQETYLTLLEKHNGDLDRVIAEVEATRDRLEMAPEGPPDYASHYLGYEKAGRSQCPSSFVRAAQKVDDVFAKQTMVIERDLYRKPGRSMLAFKYVSEDMPVHMLFEVGDSVNLAGQYQRTIVGTTVPYLLTPVNVRPRKNAARAPGSPHVKQATFEDMFGVLPDSDETNTVLEGETRALLVRMASVEAPSLYISRGEATIVHNMEPSHSTIALATRVLRRLRARKVELPLFAGAELDVSNPQAPAEVTGKRHQRKKEHPGG